MVQQGVTVIVIDATRWTAGCTYETGCYQVVMRDPNAAPVEVWVKWKHNGDDGEYGMGACRRISKIAESVGGDIAAAAGIFEAEQDHQTKEGNHG